MPQIFQIVTQAMAFGPGFRKPEQLDQIDEVWGWKLNEGDFEKIDEILEQMIEAPLRAEFVAPPL